MLLQVQNLIGEEHLKKLDRLLGKAKYIEGGKTAPAMIAHVKNNLQVDREKTKEIGDIDQLILTALWQSPVIKAACLPVRAFQPSINRHEPGMSFGAHTDSPVIGANPPMRADIAVSVFLSDPGSYEGGDLIVKTESGEARFKLPRGHALIYPGGAIHAVEKVTSGVRLAAVTWLQSAVRDSQKRQILVELDMARGLTVKNNPDSDESRLLMKVYGNLFRMWGDL
ncbi:MAG: Fe2+-dependent dioxygenase [Rhodospirillales bacterium]